MPIGTIGAFSLRGSSASGFLTHPAGSFETGSRLRVQNIALDFSKSHVLGDSSASGVEEATSIICTIGDKAAYLKRQSVIQSTASGSHTDGSTAEPSVFGCSDAELVNADGLAVAVK
jgi:hypothetical protein